MKAQKKTIKGSNTQTKMKTPIVAFFSTGNL